MTKIRVKFEYVEGDFDTDTDDIVCVRDDKRARVDLCLKANMSLPFARVVLHSKDLYVDAMEVIGSAQDLGNEICRRWKVAREAEKGLATMREFLRTAATDLGIEYSPLEGDSPSFLMDKIREELSQRKEDDDDTSREDWFCIYWSEGGCVGGTSGYCHKKQGPCDIDAFDEGECEFFKSTDGMMEVLSLNYAGAMEKVWIDPGDYTREEIVRAVKDQTTWDAEITDTGSVRCIPPVVDYKKSTIEVDGEGKE